MNKNQLLENIRVKADLKYDLLFESSYYSTLDKETQDFLKENYDRGVSLGIRLLESHPHLLDEGFFDRVKATGARAIQGAKNITGIGTQTADSKDAAVNSLFNNFKSKFDKTPGGAASTTAPGAPGATGGADSGSDKAAKEIGKDIDVIDNQSKNLPPIPLPQATDAIDKANVPKSFKDKLKAAIINNPGKTRLIIGGLAMAAGAAGSLYGIDPSVSGAVVNGIGNAILNKIQGKSTVAGALQGIGTGMVLGGLGDSISSAIGGAIAPAIAKSMGAGAAATTGTMHQAVGSYSPPSGRDAGPYTDNYTPLEPGDPGYTDTQFPGTAQSDIVPGSANDPNQGMYTEPYQSPEDLNTYSPGDREVSPEELGGSTPEAPLTPSSAGPASDVTPTAPTQAVPAAPAVKQPPMGVGTRGMTSKELGQLGARARMNPLRENNLFNKISTNHFKLKRNFLNEAVSDEQNAIIQDFLKDLGKTLNQSPEGVVKFMKSQGDRFKHILDYLPSDVGGNRNLSPTATTGQPGQPATGQPATGQPVPGQPGQSAVNNPKLIKYVNTIKSSPLFSGDLATRIAKVVDVKHDDQKGIQALKVFLKSVNGIITTQAGNARKQIGDPSAILSTLKEDADVKGLSDLSKQIVGVMPSILGLAFELRQAFSNKNPNAVSGGGKQAGAVPPKLPQSQAPKGAVPVKSTYTRINEAGEFNLTSQQIGVIKAFLSQLVNVGLAVKSTDPAQGDVAKLKNLFRSVLTLANIIVNKNTKGVKIDAKIDKAFQGKDLIGPGGGEAKPSPVKKGPGDIFKENRYTLDDYKKFF